MYINSMISEKLNIYNGLTKIILEDDEWNNFIHNLLNAKLYNLDKSKILSKSDINVINRNKCLPFCENNGLVKNYGATTNYISFVNGELGHIYFRFYWALNGAAKITAKVEEDMKIIYVKAAEEFFKWWARMKTDRKIVGKHILKKTGNSFGLGHVAAWISIIPGLIPSVDGMKITNLIDVDLLYKTMLTPYTYAAELISSWSSNNIISVNDDGSCQFVQI